MFSRAFSVLRRRISARTGLVNLKMPNHLQRRSLVLAGLLCCMAAVGQMAIADAKHVLAPKLLNAIEDQTLLLDPKRSGREGPVAPSQFFWRDLKDSFGNTSQSEYSAYPYDKAVADAWIVDDYLIVLGKSPGSVQIAVTASNKHGSMIDWFIVHVEAGALSTDRARFETAFDYELSTTYASPEVDLYLRLPPLDNATATYGIVPTLPSGITFDEQRKIIHGRLAEGTSVHYWIAVSSEQAPQIQRFRLELLTADRTVTQNTLVSMPTSSFEMLVPAGLTSTYPNVAPQRPIANGTSTDVPTVAASMPSQTTAYESFANQLNFLASLSNSMHARQRQLSELGASSLQPRQTHWSYASVGYGAQLNRGLRRKVEPSGIYVGIDSQVNQQFGTGLTLGYRGVVASNLQDTDLRQSVDGELDAFASVMPFASWEAESGTSVWGVLGVLRDPSFSSRSRLSHPRTEILGQDLFLGAMGWRQPIGSADAIQLASIGDVGMTVPLRSDLLEDGLLDYLDTGTRRMSAGLEMSFRYDSQLYPYVGVNRHVSIEPDSLNSALEALGGIRYATLNGLTLEAEGRALAPNNVFENPDLLLSIAARLDPGLRGEGFAFSVAPVYGVSGSPFATTSNLFMPYYQPIHSRSPRYRYSRDWMMSGSLSYGLNIGGGVVTPFGQIAVSTLNETRMGVRVAMDSKMDRLFNLEIATVKSRFQQQAIDKGIDIQLRFVF